jgi:hypothetical protein
MLARNTVRRSARTAAPEYLGAPVGTVASRTTGGAPAPHPTATAMMSAIHHRPMPLRPHG